MNLSAVNKVYNVYKTEPVSQAQPVTTTEPTHSASLTTPSSTIEISAEARARASAAGVDQTRYKKTGDVDKEADALAVKLNGVSSVKIPNFGDREFDVVSSKYVAQTNRSESVTDFPRNFLNKQHRNQIKATLGAARQEGKSALFVFEKAVPPPDVVDYIRQHTEEAGVEYNISDPNKPIS